MATDTETKNLNVEGIEERALKFVMDSFTIYKDRSGLETKWEEADKIYNCIPSEKFYEGVSNQYPPETRKACKSLINFADETAFSSDPPFRIKGEGGNNDKRRADLDMRMLSRDMAKSEMRMKMRSRGYENLVKYGILIVKAPYMLNERKVIADAAERSKIRTGIFSNIMSMITGAQKKTETLFDGTGFEVMDIHAMYWNYYRKWEEQDCIIERRIVSWNHLKANEMRRTADGTIVGVYRNLDKVLADESAELGKDETIDEKFSHIADITGLSGSYKTSGKRYELLEAWCNFDLDGDGIDEECVIVVLNGKYVIRVDPNPFDLQRKIYYQALWEGVEGTSIGIGVPQICKRDQIALNDYMNQVMDNITQILNNMWIVDSLAGIPDAQLKSRPNGIIKSQVGIDAVRPLEKPLTTDHGLRAVAVVKESIQSNSGASVSFQGLPSKYNTTATEVQSSNNAAARDVFTKIRMLEDHVIRPWLRQARSNNWQFRSREEMVRIFGKDAALVVSSSDASAIRDEMLRDDDIVVLGATQIENKVIKVQQLINYLNVAAGTGQGIVNFPLLHAKIWEQLGDGDTNMILPQPTDEMVSPNDENILMSQGETCTAKPQENHRQHIMAHSSHPFPMEFREIVNNHIQQHIMIEQARAQQMLMQNAQQQMGGGSPIQPQMQPRLAPDPMTEQNVGKMTNMPVSETGMV